LIVGAVPNIACATGTPLRRLESSSTSSIRSDASCRLDTIDLISDSTSGSRSSGTRSHELKQSMRVVRTSLPWMDEM
jgi:hypothetical protein